MKLVIAGSRGINDMQHLRDALAAWIKHADFPITSNVTEVISGMCPNSPDMLGIEWAKSMGIPVKEMPAEWLGRDAIRDPSAGRRRNVAMAKYAVSDRHIPGALLAIWDGTSPGTKHMINAARSRGLKVFIWKVKV